MNMMTDAILAVTAIAAIITTITAAVGAVGRVAPESSTSRPVPAGDSLTPAGRSVGGPMGQPIPMASLRGIRRQTMRDSGMSRPVGLIQPQYLPALALSQLLRLQMTPDKEIRLR